MLWVVFLFIFTWLTPAQFSYITLNITSSVKSSLNHAYKLGLPPFILSPEQYTFSFIAIISICNYNYLCSSFFNTFPIHWTVMSLRQRLCLAHPCKQYLFVSVRQEWEVLRNNENTEETHDDNLEMRAWLVSYNGVWWHWQWKGELSQGLSKKTFAKEEWAGLGDWLNSSVIAWFIEGWNYNMVQNSAWRLFIL